MSRLKWARVGIDLFPAKANPSEPPQRKYTAFDQGKFKYPVYFTEEYLPASTLETFKMSEGGEVQKDNLNDFVTTKIYLGELQLQLERSKKEKAPGDVTIDIKLIAS